MLREPFNTMEQPMRILLVEDNMLNALALGRMLERRGNDVSYADGGRKALDLLSSNEFDIVLMDLMMPDMDGFETTRRIRSMDSPQACIPIVAVTALMASQALDRCMQAGMDSFLTKPVEEKDFRDVADRFVPGPHPCPA